MPFARGASRKSNRSHQWPPKFAPNAYKRTLQMLPLRWGDSILQGQSALHLPMRLTLLLDLPDVKLKPTFARHSRKVGIAEFSDEYLNSAESITEAPSPEGALG